MALEQNYPSTMKHNKDFSTLLTFTDKVLKKKNPAVRKWSEAQFVLQPIVKLDNSNKNILD